MQVQEKTNEGLKRAYTVKVPAAKISEAVEARLSEVSTKVQLPGFRPGKVPLSVVRQQYGASVRMEVLEKLVSDTSRELLTERGLRPALQPVVDDVKFEEGDDLEYALSLEIIPEISPIDLKTIAVERLVVEPTEAEMAEAITRLPPGAKPTKVVTDERPAKMGDVAVIDFDGKVDGEARPGMAAKAQPVELGSNMLIDTFETQVAGMKVGEEKLIKVTFPADYHATELAGKLAEFDVKLVELREVDAETLNVRIKQALENEYKAAARMKTKRALLDALAKAHSFDVPQNMVDHEFSTIWQQREQQGADPEEKGKTEDEIKAEYRAIAERRVRLGLLLAEIGNKNKVQVTGDELRQAVIAQARNFPGQEREVLEFYQKNGQALDSLRAPLYEDKVIDLLLTMVKVTEKPGKLDDLKAVEA
jgi:trigger factor